MKDSVNYNVTTIHLQHSLTAVNVDSDSVSGKTAYTISLSEEAVPNENADNNSNVFLYCLVALMLAFGVWLLCRKRHDRERQKSGESQEANLRHELLKQSEIYKDLVRKGYFSVNGKEPLSSVKEKEVSSLCDAVVSVYQDFPSFLRAKCPELSEKDFRFCCLVKSGLSTFELAEIYSVSESAIFKRKQKEKEKLGLQNDKRTLDEILLEVS